MILSSCGADGPTHGRRIWTPDASHSCGSFPPGTPCPSASTRRSTTAIPTTTCWGTRLLRSLRRLASEARQAGQVILLEPLSQFESNTCTTAAELAEVLAELNDPCVLPMCDVVASFVQGETAETLYRLTGGAMAHLHIADSDGRSENHLLPGDGVLPLREQLQALRRAGYDGAATIELVSMYTDDPTYYAKCAIERVRELL